MNTNIVILGGGVSGIGAALLAHGKGYNVFLSDQGIIADNQLGILKSKKIDFEQNGHTEARILQAKEVIKSPGIPDDAPLIKKIRSHGIPVIGEIEFAARFTEAKLISITGTNGKTTTTLLLFHLLKSAGLNVGLAGNVGQSFAKQVLENNFDYYVLELSSFQLDNIEAFRSDIAILLNITPDHLNRYQNNIELYIASKFRIIKNARSADQFVYYYDDDNIKDYHQQHDSKVVEWPISLSKGVEKGATLVGDQLQFKGIGLSDFTIPLAQLPLKGAHNMINIMTAVVAASLLDIGILAITKALQTFKSVEHRLESVAIVDGVEYINDSKATNVDAAYFALGAFDNPIIWIAGGVDKGNDYQQILSFVQEKVKVLICLGKDNQKLKTFFDSSVDTLCESQAMQEAVELAKNMSSTGDVVLLSPACASFDLFKNYEDRGNQFKAAVKEINNHKKEEV